MLLHTTSCAFALFVIFLFAVKIYLGPPSVLTGYWFQTHLDAKTHRTQVSHRQWHRLLMEPRSCPSVDVNHLWTPPKSQCSVSSTDMKAVVYCLGSNSQDVPLTFGTHFAPDVLHLHLVECTDKKTWFHSIPSDSRSLPLCP